MIEVWKEIKGYEGLYKISDSGNIVSLTRNCNKLRKQSIDHKGYKRISLNKNNKRKHCRIHRLVAENFIINDKNKPQVNHIDGNKENNNVKNLEWCTNRENIDHAFRIGLKDQKGSKNNSSKLDESKIRCIRLSNCSNETLSEIYNVSIHTIYCIKTRRYWRHVS